jgi:hypothetical protein
VIRQVERYHGAALARLLRAEDSQAIELRAHRDYRSAYTLDNRLALYVKYSTSRLSPWTFAFKAEHQQEIAALLKEFADAFITLVCGTDGIACLSGSEYRQLLGDDPGSGEWIRVARGARQKYAVSGSDGRRVSRIGDNEYPAKVYTAIRGESLGDE